MRTIVGIVVLLASLGAIGVTMSMNASYQYGQGASPSEAVLRAVAMGVFDCVKAGLPVGMAWWWARRQWLLLALGATMFVFCFVMSLILAVGFYATNHTAVARGREGVTISYRDAREQYDQTQTRIGELGAVRPVEVVEAALQALRADKRFSNSKACADATLQASRDFCREYFATEGELAAARELQRLQARREALQSSIAQLLKAGAERDADPQVTVLSRLLPFLQLQDVKLGVDLLPSLLLEIVAAFGLLLATSMMQRSPAGDSNGGGDSPTPPAPRSGPRGPDDRRKPMTFKVRRDGTYVIDGSQR